MLGKKFRSLALTLLSSWLLMSSAAGAQEIHRLIATRCIVPVAKGSRAAAVQAYNLGCQQYSQNKASDAATSFRHAIELDPTLPVSHGPLGQILFLKGAYEQAFPYLQVAVSNDPDNATYWCQLGVTATRIHNSSVAKFAFTKYLSLEPAGSYAQEAERCLHLLSAESVQSAGDYLQEFGRTPRKWAATENLRVCLVDASGVSGFEPTSYAAVASALGDWTDASGGRVSFQLVNNPQDAQIVCRWTSNVSDLQGSDELATTRLEFNRQGTIQRATITFLTELKGTATAQERNSRARSVAVHEVGHALGLQHSHDAGDIMYATVAPIGLEFSPSLRDRNTLTALYR